MKKKYLIIGGIILFVLILIGAGGSSTKDEVPAEKSANQEIAQQPSQASAPKYKYEILSRVEDKVDENISVLIEAGETDSQGLAAEVQENCKKQCNISLYDDKKAFELNEQYDKMMGASDTQPSDLQEWKEKNYVFVAEHLVGTVGYSFGSYDDYPFKDWYYEELKAGE